MFVIYPLLYFLRVYLTNWIWSIGQGGVLGSAILKAKNIGKQDTVISQGIEGEDLKALEGPAGAAKARHAENKRKREEIETAKKRETEENSRI